MRRILFCAIMLVMVSTLISPGAALAAQSGQTWSSEIIWFNPATVDPPPADGKKLSAIYYTTDRYRYFPGEELAGISYKGQTGTLLVGSTVTESFTGGAVISAEVPVIAVYKQVPTGKAAYSPILYSSFESWQADESTGYFFIPTVQRSIAYVSEIGIQNVAMENIEVSLHFFANGSGSEAFSFSMNDGQAEEKFKSLRSQTARVFKLSDLPGFPSTFDGSLYITAVLRTDHGTPAPIVAAVQEIQGGGRRAYAYEGIKSGAVKVYMPSALCKVGSTKQTSYYAIQNTSTTTATVATVEFYDSTGRLVTSYVTDSIPPLAKVSVNTCGDTNHAIGRYTTGKQLSAVIRSGDGTTGNPPIAAVGKIVSSDGLSTAFTGMLEGAFNDVSRKDPADSLYHVVLPYVEWSSSKYSFRTYIAIMNASSTPTGYIHVIYYRRNESKDHQTIYAPVTKEVSLANNTVKVAGGAKRSTDPSAARILDKGGNFIGGVEVISDQPIAVLARVQRGVSGVAGIKTLGEDYSATLLYKK
jgi:hypothetical protein